MTRGTDAFEGFEEEFGGKGRIYRERDVPPNQAFQNLQSRCELRLGNWNRASFEEKVQIEMEIAGYLRIMRDLLLQHGIKLQGVGKFNTERLRELEGLHNREVLVGMIGDTRSLIARLELGKDYARDLYQAYEDLIEHDPRVNPDYRERLKTSLKPVALQEAMQQIQRDGGPQSSHSTSYILEESQKLGEPVTQLVSQRQQGKSSTALLRIDDVLLQAYVRNYYKLEVIFKVLRWKIGQEKQDLASLEQSLQANGGPLKPDEQLRLAQFESGRDPDRNIGVYTGYLDYLRFVGETVFRHGWPKGK